MLYTRFGYTRWTAKTPSDLPGIGLHAAAAALSITKPGGSLDTPLLPCGNDACAAAVREPLKQGVVSPTLHTCGSLPT
jgi:hypothetical protein